MTDMETTLARLCCYMARMQDKHRRPCITADDIRRATGTDPMPIIKHAQASDLIMPTARVGCGTLRATVWALTKGGRAFAENAPPEVKAWRMSPPRRIAA
jgi:hypothetical protein